jgi:hypothetical protein
MLLSYGKKRPRIIRSTEVVGRPNGGQQLTCVNRNRMMAQRSRPTPSVRRSRRDIRAFFTFKDAGAIVQRSPPVRKTPFEWRPATPPRKIHCFAL